jgi:hypothetical protein
MFHNVLPFRSRGESLRVEEIKDRRLIGTVLCHHDGLPSALRFIKRTEAVWLRVRFACCLSAQADALMFLELLSVFQAEDMGNRILSLLGAQPEPRHPGVRRRERRG